MTYKDIICKIADSALNLLFPRRCPVCGRILTRDLVKDSINPYICGKCYEGLSFPEGARCLKCSRPVQDELQELCRDCAGKRKNFDQGTALLMHDGPSQKIIYDLKFSNKRDNADMLASEAGRRYMRQIRFWNPDMIIPVPLYRKKEFERGFNQSELLSEKLSKYLKEKGTVIPVRNDILVRIRATKPMKTLDSEGRRVNIQGAFSINSRRPEAYGELKGKKVLLVDDIYTSGATLSECAGVLKQYGVSKVYFLTFSIG